MHQNPVRPGSAGSALKLADWSLSSSQSIDSCASSGASKPVSEPVSDASEQQW